MLSSPKNITSKRLGFPAFCAKNLGNFLEKFPVLTGKTAFGGVLTPLLILAPSFIFNVMETSLSEARTGMVLEPETRPAFNIVTVYEDFAGLSKHRRKPTTIWCTGWGMILNSATKCGNSKSWAMPK